MHNRTPLAPAMVKRRAGHKVAKPQIAQDRSAETITSFITVIIETLGGPLLGVLYILLRGQTCK
eukprot:4542972-Heterocapsa_arctica.AAC.1